MGHVLQDPGHAVRGPAVAMDGHVMRDRMREARRPCTIRLVGGPGYGVREGYGWLIAEQGRDLPDLCQPFKGVSEIHIGACLSGAFYDYLDDVDLKEVG